MTLSSEQPADVFISYKSEDRPTAGRIAAALSASGWKVWWDHNILAGEAYRKVIGEQLATARCVIVLWSKLSVESDFVLDEAGRALRRGALIPVRIEPVEMPLGFGQKDYTDIIGWAGENEHAGIQELRAAITKRLTGTEVTPGVTVPEKPPIWRWILAAIVTVLGTAIALGLWILPRRDPLPDPRVEPARTTTPAPVSVQVATSHGGIAAGIVTPSGYVVVPCHVLGGESAINVTGAGHWDGPGTVKARDCDRDIALIELKQGRMIPNKVIVRFAGSLKRGETIERYRGPSDRTPGTVTEPLKLMTLPLGDGKNLKLEMLVTTHIARGGDSGAPVLDANGHVVGMLWGGDGRTQSVSIPIETIREVSFLHLQTW